MSYFDFTMDIPEDEHKGTTGAFNNLYQKRGGVMNDNFEKRIKEAGATDKLLSKIGDLVSQKMANDKALSYKDALNQVLKENPDLAEQVKAYQQKAIKDKISGMDPGKALAPVSNFSEYLRYFADSEIHNDIHKITTAISKREGIPYGEAVRKVTHEVLAEAGICDRVIRNSFASFCDELIRDGKITPGMRAATTDFLEVSLRAGIYEFSEGSRKRKVFVLDTFKALLRGLPGRHEKALCISKRDGIPYRDALNKIST